MVVGGESESSESRDAEAEESARRKLTESVETRTDQAAEPRSVEAMETSGARSSAAIKADAPQCGQSARGMWGGWRVRDAVSMRKTSGK